MINRQWPNRRAWSGGRNWSLRYSEYVKTAVCNKSAFEPFQRLVAGPLRIEDLPHAEQFARAVVLHDDIRMLPERFRMEVSESGDVVTVPEIVRSDGFETFGSYQDPVYEDDEGQAAKLLQASVQQLEPGKHDIDFFQLSFTLAAARIVIGGSAVVRDSVFEINVVDGSNKLEPRMMRSKASWEERFARAEAYPMELFSQLDESWRQYAQRFSQQGHDLRVPPVLGVVLSRCLRRDAIPTVLLDLRYEWAGARKKVWNRLDALRDARNPHDELQIERELTEATKLFSPEPSEHDSRPTRVFWEMAAGAAAGAAITAVTGVGLVAGAATGAITAASRSMPALLQEFGPALFRRGAFDLAKKVHQATSQVEFDALGRLLSEAEKRTLGIN